METTLNDVLDRADQLEHDDHIEAAERRAQRFAGALTGTSGTLAADVLRLVQRIKQLEASEAPQERIYDSINRPCPVDGAGTTAKFGTGAVRSDTVEAFRYDLISPIGLREVARTCAEGAQKYGDWNWEKGMPVGDLLNHALAHVYTYLSGDRSEPHLGHAAWNLLAAIHSDELWPRLNDGTLRSPGCAPPDAAFKMQA
jgi:hypothetical protein